MAGRCSQNVAVKNMSTNACLQTCHTDSTVKELKEKVIIITGAGGAIAGYVAEAFTDMGARPLLVDNDPIRLQGVASSTGAFHLEADVGTPAGAEAMVQVAKERYNRVDGLIHLVGTNCAGQVQDLAPSVYDDVFDSNMRSLFYAVRAVLPELLEKNQGFIAGMGSKDSWLSSGTAGASLFAAAKSAVATFLHSLDQELRGTDVNVSIIYPMGLVDTTENRRSLPRKEQSNLIDIRRIADIMVTAAQFGPGARLVDLPVYSSPSHPPREA